MKNCIAKVVSERIVSLAINLVNKEKRVRRKRMRKKKIKKKIKKMIKKKKVVNHLFLVSTRFIFD